LFFGSTNDFQLLSRQIPSTAKAVILRMSRMPYMDQSGLYVIEETLTDLTNQGIVVLVVGLLEQPKYMMENIKTIPNIIPKEHLFEDFDSCVGWVSNHSNELKE
jgi:SulP family sulfate permease